jgi:phage terminase large subunit GpA-like protein
MTRLDEITAAAYAALRPPAKLRLSDWVESNVHLPSTIAAAPGRMRLYPYQREMADSMGDPTVERTTVLKSARVGYTQLAVAALAHYAANDPAPVLAVLPAEADAKHLMTGVIEPTFRESPALTDLLDRDTFGRDTMLSRAFPGGSLKLVSAASPRNLRALTARVLILDELDGWEIDARGEGDPLTLAEKRTFSFADRKIIAGSTPVDEETSRICRLYAQSDQRIWECPCPHCGEFHEITWSAITWPKDRPEEAAWACPSCGALTADRGKAPMLLAGRWRATRPDVVGHAGFRINALSSLLPNAAWPKLVAEFLEAKKSPVTLKPWVNTILGEPWRGEGDDLDPADLARLHAPLATDPIPEDALFLTAGVDVQGDRLEATLAGWTADHGIRVLEHVPIWGGPREPATWRDLDDWLRRQFRHAAGGLAYIDATVVDSGYHADEVLAFTGPRTARRIVAGKGVSGFHRPRLAWGAQRKTRLAQVGVDPIKLEIHDRMRDGRTIQIADHLGRDILEQYAAERLVTRMHRGHPTRQWELIPGRRNEALDCLSYAIAARQLIALDPARRAKEVESPRPPEKAPRVSRSKWLSG